jgi:hypothetical protein
VFLFSIKEDGETSDYKLALNQSGQRRPPYLAQDKKTGKISAQAYEQDDLLKSSV